MNLKVKCSDSVIPPSWSALSLLARTSHTVRHPFVSRFDLPGRWQNSCKKISNYKGGSEKIMHSYRGGGGGVKIWIFPLHNK